MSITPAHRLMVEPLSVDPKRCCQLIGYITKIDKDVKETKLLIRCIDERKYEDNVSFFEVMFVDPSRKIFVDQNVKVDDLVVCTCELISTQQDGKINLELRGNYLMVFRGSVDIWNDPTPIYIDPEDLPDREDYY